MFSFPICHNHSPGRPEWTSLISWIPIPPNQSGLQIIFQLTRWYLLFSFASFERKWLLIYSILFATLEGQRNIDKKNIWKDRKTGFSVVIQPPKEIWELYHVDCFFSNFSVTRSHKDLGGLPTQGCKLRCVKGSWSVLY